MDRVGKNSGVILAALVFGVFGIWAALAPLDGAAYAVGKVNVASYSKTVQHLEGGIVREIYVSNGDRVEAGDGGSIGAGADGACGGHLGASSGTDGDLLVSRSVCFRLHPFFGACDCEFCGEASGGGDVGSLSEAIG